MLLSACWRLFWVLDLTENSFLQQLFSIQWHTVGGSKMKSREPQGSAQHRPGVVAQRGGLRYAAG